MFQTFCLLINKILDVIKFFSNPLICFQRLQSFIRLVDIVWYNSVICRYHSLIQIEIYWENFIKFHTPRRRTPNSVFLWGYMNNHGLIYSITHKWFCHNLTNHKTKIGSKTFLLKKLCLLVIAIWINCLILRQVTEWMISFLSIIESLSANIKYRNQPVYNEQIRFI